MTTRALHPAVVFNLLHGIWSLDRTIPGHATMHGTATFTPSPPEKPPTDTLSSQLKATPQPQWRDPLSPATNPVPTTLYNEQVTLHTTSGAHLTGTAHYLYSQRPDGALDVHLTATGALFHTLRFTPTTQGHLEAHATHLCAADTYTSTYRILSPDHLTIEHHVRGPRKHYTSQTTLTRLRIEPKT